MVGICIHVHQHSEQCLVGVYIHFILYNGLIIASLELVCMSINFEQYFVGVSIHVFLNNFGGFHIHAISSFVLEFAFVVIWTLDFTFMFICTTQFYFWNFKICKYRFGFATVARLMHPLLYNLNAFLWAIMSAFTHFGSKRWESWEHSPSYWVASSGGVGFVARRMSPLNPLSRRSCLLKKTNSIAYSNTVTMLSWVVLWC